jgi:translation initiation factor 3 subunit D
LLKLGFVSRVTPSDATKHEILGLSSHKPVDFAAQINLSERNMWGIVRAVVDLIMSKEPGKYLLVRDSNKPVLRLYRVPMSSFEDEGMQDDEDDFVEDDAQGGDEEQ